MLLLPKLGTTELPPTQEKTPINFDINNQNRGGKRSQKVAEASRYRFLGTKNRVFCDAPAGISISRAHAWIMQKYPTTAKQARMLNEWMSQKDVVGYCNDENDNWTCLSTVQYDKSG